MHIMQFLQILPPTDMRFSRIARARQPQDSRAWARSRRRDLTLSLNPSPVHAVYDVTDVYTWVSP
jgi:hypothetical protein